MIIQLCPVIKYVKDLTSMKWRNQDVKKLEMLDLVMEKILRLIRELAASDNISAILVLAYPNICKQELR